MPDRNLHRVRGIVSGANWRLTKFDAAVPHHLTCGLCRVISPTTILLPCSHALCESCVSNGVHDGDSVCPFDAEPFTVEECPRFQLQAAASNKFKACCWNEAHGCTFVGTLQAILTHYEQDCTFHAATCPRCNGHVLQQDLPRHYRDECPGEVITSSAAETILSQGVVGSASCLDEFKALIGNFYQDWMPAVHSTINKLLEATGSMNSAVEAITGSCRESEHRIMQALGQLSATFSQELQSQQPALCVNVKESFRINEISEQVLDHGRRLEAIVKTFSDMECSLRDQLAEAADKLSSTFGQELQSHQAGVCDDLRKHFETNKISEQVKSHGQQIEAIAKTLRDSELRLSHQLAEAVEELSTTFAQKLQSQQSELCAQLKQISEVETSNAGEARTTNANEMPWRLEKRHILRKLELVATDSHAYLELLRTIADQQLKRPVVEYKPVLPDSLAGTEVMPPLMCKCESEEGYTVTITNIYDLVVSEKLIGLFTRWYRRDRYLQVATYGWSYCLEQMLTVCLKWGTTVEGSCTASHEAHVWIKHPDYPQKEHLQVSKLGSVGSRAALLGFQENFAVSLLELDQLGLVRDGKLTLVVSMKI